MVLRALGPDPGSYYDSDDEAVPTRLPLLRNQSQHATYSIDPNLSQRGASWNIKINDKVNYIANIYKVAVKRFKVLEFYSLHLINSRKNFTFSLKGKMTRHTL